MLILEIRMHIVSLDHASDSVLYLHLFFHRGAIAIRRYEEEENIQVISPRFAIFLAVKSYLPHSSLI